MFKQIDGLNGMTCVLKNRFLSGIVLAAWFFVKEYGLHDIVTDVYIRPFLSYIMYYIKEKVLIILKN